MNEAEIIKKIAEKKQKKAKDLKIDQHMEFLIFGQANARYWASWMPNQPSIWVEKLFELLNFKSIRTYDEVVDDKKLDCKEFVFPDHTFTFKISDFRSSYWDASNLDTYANLYVFFNDKQVASFALVQEHDKYMDMRDPKIISVDSFIEGEWIERFNKFVENAKLFYHWDKDQDKKDKLAREAKKLKENFGITEDEIAEISSTIAKVHESEVEGVKKGASFEIDLDKLNEQKKAYETGEGIAAWVKANPFATICIIAFALVLLGAVL